MAGARPAPFWCDTHVHMDDARFADPDAVRQQARAAGVAQLLIPAVHPGNFDRVMELARRWGDVCALGIHPLHIPPDVDAALSALDQALRQAVAAGLAVVAVGEAGLDLFEPHLRSPDMQARQSHCLRAQLRLARQLDLPVILHTRQAVDAVLKHLRQTPVRGGIAHAFSGSLQQAQQLVEMGFKIGLGGAVTFDRAQRLRTLARTLPLHALVLETDAPDMPPSWCYVSAAQRAAGTPPGLNQPAEIPRIAQVLADLRGLPLHVIQQQMQNNTAHALPAWQQHWLQQQ